MRDLGGKIVAVREPRQAAAGTERQKSGARWAIAGMVLVLVLAMARAGSRP